MSLNKLAILLVVLLGSGVSHADVYQWTDEKGVTHFSDKPVSSKAKKLNIQTAPDTETENPVSDNSVKNSGDTDTGGEVQNDKADTATLKSESKKEAADKSREKLTEELIKAREIREAERKKRKEEIELQKIKCQEEKTKLALMNNEMKEYDDKLKTMTRSERSKSNEYILKSDLEAQKKRLEESTQELCN